MSEAENLGELVLVRVPGVPDIVVMSWIVMGLIIVLCAFAVRKMKYSPSGLQNALEFVFEWLMEKCGEIMGENASNFLPLFITLFLYIFFSNLIGILPGFKSPTSSLNTTVALALVVFFTVHYTGIKKNGFFGYLKHFMGEPIRLPSRFLSMVLYMIFAPLFFIIHVIGEIARPVSLSVRLFGNIMAKELLLGILAMLILLFYPIPFIGKPLMLAPLLLRPAIILLAVLVSFVQALVFTFLSMVYIAGAMGEEH
jgi:F-type H+-transporting ATPase subunit a